MERTLLLNSTFEPLKIISWQRAITLLTQGKVEVIDFYDREVRGVSSHLPASLHSSSPQTGKDQAREPGGPFLPRQHLSAGQIYLSVLRQPVSRGRPDLRPRCPAGPGRTGNVGEHRYRLSYLQQPKGWEDPAGGQDASDPASSQAEMDARRHTPSRHQERAHELARLSLLEHRTRQGRMNGRLTRRAFPVRSPACCTANTLPHCIASMVMLTLRSPPSFLLSIMMVHAIVSLAKKY